MTSPWLIFLISLFLRLVPVLLTRSLGIGLDDMFQYDMLGRSLANGNGYRWYAYEDLQRLEPYVDFDLSSVDYDPNRGVLTSFRAPLYPAFIGLIYSITGVGATRFIVVRLVQAVLSALLVPLTFYLSLRLFPDKKLVAVIAAWIVALYPMLIIYPIGLATENLFFLLVLISLLLLLKAADDPRPKNFVLSGLFLGLAALTRSVVLPFAGLAVLWMWIILKQKRGAIIIAITFLVLVTPWMVRNSILHNKLTGIESSMGYNLYVGYHPESDGSFTFGVSLDLISILDDADRDNLGMTKALEFIQADPTRFLPLALNRLGFFFGLEKRAIMYFYSNDLLGYIPRLQLLAITTVLLLPFVFVSVSAVPSLVITRYNSHLTLIYLFLAAYILPHVFILSEDRFHLAIIPYLAIFSAKTLTAGWGPFIARWQASVSGKLLIVLTILVSFFLLVNWGYELGRDTEKIAALLGPNGNQTYYPY